MSRVYELTELLKRLNSGESPEHVKREAQELLREVDPVDLSLAEQRLIEEGTNPEELRSLCALHLEMLEGELRSLKASLVPGHPIHTLVAEHDEIMRFLDELEGVNSRIQGGVSGEILAASLETLSHIAHHLMEAERHHKREEDALFPELEKRGITGPPRIMRLEHDELRKRKKRLAELAGRILEQPSLLGDGHVRRELDDIVKYILFNLRDHIFKENNILYPSALDAITEQEVWLEIKRKCDEIGYCCFTPER